ncbi:hypothetical protein GCM10023340_38900 [Nocardioides marinquilinus]|uniref:Ig-like domain repeat protein n=1 Tax=Nocardioides marinquilinus TaxID=1210400 RepID=A0ABP9PZL9_9ACTN
MSTDTTEAKPSTQKAALEAVSSKTLKCPVGTPLIFTVKGSKKPTAESSDGLTLLVAPSSVSGEFRCSWVPVEPGEHTVSVSTGEDDDTPVVFKITATPLEG